MNKVGYFVVYRRHILLVARVSIKEIDPNPMKVK